MDEPGGHFAKWNKTQKDKYYMIPSIICQTHRRTEYTSGSKGLPYLGPQIYWMQDKKVGILAPHYASMSFALSHSLL
jgi:hypothetical protein